MISVLYHRLEFSHPALQEPSWKDRVDRWSQLDAAAFGMAEIAEVELRLGWPRPTLLILAGPGASNETDRRFVDSGALSPSKFTHTLPNIRASAYCQTAGWTGRLLSLHRDPETLEYALAEAAFWITAGEPGVSVYSNVRLNESGSAKYAVQAYHFVGRSSSVPECLPDFEARRASSGDPVVGALRLPHGWELVPRKSGTESRDGA